LLNFVISEKVRPLDSPDEITGIALETLVLQNIKAWIDSQPLKSKKPTLLDKVT
jgi:hypothetical protein